MRLSKKLVSILLSVLMVLSAIPFSAVTAYAAPSKKKTATSVAAASDWDVNDLASGDLCYYFNSLEEAFEYAKNNKSYFIVTMLKDVELSEPLVYTDLEQNEGATLYFETNGHTLSAPNGNALEFKDMWQNVFVNAYRWSLKGGDGITGYGGITAKDYAITVEYANLVVEGGTFSSETTDCPWLVETDGYIGNIRQCAVIKNENTLYENGYFGSNGNIYIRNKNNDINSLKHVFLEEVNGVDAYTVANHNYAYTTKSITPDRQSAVITSECVDCHYQSGEMDAVALVGDQGYPSIQTAIADADGKTVELLQDITISTSINFEDGVDITFELNNHTITHPSGYFVIDGGKVTFKNGVINSNSNNVFLMSGSTDSTVEEYSVLNLDNCDIINTYDGGSVNNLGACIFLMNPGWGPPYSYYGISVNIIDSDLASQGYCLVNNGNYANQDNFNTTKINIEYSSMTSEQITPMYIAGYAVVNTLASKYVGYISATEIRAGVLNVLGPDEEGNINTYECKFDGESSASHNNSGTTTEGAALAVAQHNLAPVPNPVRVYIYDGKFDGGISVMESMVENIAEPDVEIHILGGEFNGEEASVKSDSCEGFISGGKFSVDPEVNYVKSGLSTRLDTDDMYVLTDLDFTAYKAAVSIAKHIDKSIYTDASLLALDDSIIADYLLTTQEEIDLATANVETRYNELEYREFTVTFIAETENTSIPPISTQYKYGDIVSFDISYIDEDVYKWTITDDNSTKRLPADSKKVSFVVKGDSTVTVYTKENKTTESNLTKITYVSNKNHVLDIDYVEDASSFEKIDAPEIPFYVFTGWDQVDENVYKATYSYNDAKYCRFVGGIDVAIQYGEDISTNNDEGISVPYDELVSITTSVDGQIALAADKDGKNIITYINDIATIHAPKRDTVYVIVLPKRMDATVGVTGGYIKFEADSKKKVAINGQFYLPTDCSLVDTGAILCNKNGDFMIGGTGVIKLASTLQSSQNEFTVTLTTNYGSMQNIYARTYLTYKDSSGTVKTIYSTVKTIDLTIDGTLK